MVVVAQLLQLNIFFAVTVFFRGGVAHSAAVIGGRRRRARDSSSGVRLMIFLSESVLVVMHPHFQNPFLQSSFAAEFINQIFIFFLHFPPDPLRESHHFLLLILGEFCAEPFAAAGAHPRRQGGVNSS